MQPHPMYATVLTDGEKRLGFITALVSNPRFEFYGNPSLVPAVIRVLGPGDMIIKLTTNEYSHRKFGDYTPEGGHPDWKPVCVPMPDAGQCIRSATTGLDARPPIGQTVYPGTPSLALACPECATEFDLPADHLPLPSTQTCPACKKQKPAEEFVRHNM